jgi:hypothetical protein
VLLQPVPDARPDRGRHLRGDRGPPVPWRCCGLRCHSRPGGAAFDRLRTGVRGGLRDPVPAAIPSLRAPSRPRWARGRPKGRSDRASTR